jgi:DNA-binding cell septation regulator SpoVG
VDRFCPRCGAKFPGGRTTSGGYFADVVHPIRASTRAYLHGEVIRAFEAARDDQLAAKEAS